MAEPGSDLRVRTLGTNRRARCTQRRECSTLEVSMGYCARRAVVWVSSPARCPRRDCKPTGQGKGLPGALSHLCVCRGGTPPAARFM